MGLSREELAGGFRRLGLSRGDAAEVHSSLSSLGHVDGGAETLVDALMDVVGPEGALVMSAYPISRGRPLTEEDGEMGITYKAEVIPEDSTEPTNVGTVVDHFKRRPGVLLGRGVHRGAAWGRDARLNCRDYRHLVETGGKVLLVGVDIGHCSCMHIPDETVGLPAEISTLSRLPEDVLRKYPEEKWYVECSRASGPPGPGWNAVWDEAVAAGLIRTGKVGGAECHLFRASDILGIYERRLREDPWKLYGVARE